MCDEKAKYSKYCLVPKCTTTSTKIIEKAFVTLPSGTRSTKSKNLRNLWLRAMGRNISDITYNTTGFVCEDHFHLFDFLRADSMYLTDLSIVSCQLHMRGTGGGPPSTVRMTPIEEDIQKLLGAQITGFVSEFDNDADCDFQERTAEP
ncbi:hypothetical protein ABEB36_009571 [Hypothenemus hampei]|uniref:THAP-type domain-containing protein n=1 Tax=Hypothenemus hampei TaxID=57062 RepID=A0ABD1EGR2_HYPHA